MLNCLLTDPNVNVSSATIKGMIANWVRISSFLQTSLLKIKSVS